MAVPKQPYGEIKLPTLLYGDNGWATLVDVGPDFSNNEGMILRPFLIHPSHKLVNLYPQLQRKDNDWIPTSHGDCVWTNYPIEYINDLDRSRTGAIIRVACGYDGRDTYEMERIKFYTEEIRQLRKQRDRLVFLNLSLTEELNGLTKTIKAQGMEMSELYKGIKGEKNEDIDQPTPGAQGKDY